MAYYKGMRVNTLGLPVLKNKKRIRIKKENRKRNFYHTAFSSPFNKESPKNLILMYDVVEAKKKERDWFRRRPPRCHPGAARVPRIVRGYSGRRDC